jgi:hypothetical protein
MRTLFTNSRPHGKRGWGALFGGRAIIAYKTYFCPQCGRDYESGECQRSAKSISLWPRCPACDKSLQLSGWAFIALGFLIWMFSGLILDTNTPLAGEIVGAAFGLFGLVRLARAECARRHSRRGSPANDGPPMPGSSAGTEVGASVN